jgi:hypothetical protein
MWNGSTVFLADRCQDGNVRAGKIMGYDAVTGHRVKEPFNQVNWVHSVRKLPDFRMKQCLFGEHLLSDTSATMSSKPVAIVESEKTALIAALSSPTSPGLPPEGMHGCFNSEAMQVLEGREVILFPDLKGDGRMEATAADVGIRLQACHLLRPAGEGWRPVHSVKPDWTSPTSC